MSTPAVLASVTIAVISALLGPTAAVAGSPAPGCDPCQMPGCRKKCEPLPEFPLPPPAQ